MSKSSSRDYGRCLSRGLYMGSVGDFAVERDSFAAWECLGSSDVGAHKIHKEIIDLPSTHL